MSEEIAICPCGKKPNSLCISDAGQGGKWANVSGVCCGEWSIEFRTMYFALDSDQCMKLAIESWNVAPRSDYTALLCEVKELARCLRASLDPVPAGVAWSKHLVRTRADCEKALQQPIISEILRNEK